MGVILPGVDGTGFSPSFSWDWVRNRLIFVGVGRERFENSLLCHPLTHTHTQYDFVNHLILMFMLNMLK